jgi:hypothetical protein
METNSCYNLIGAGGPTAVLDMVVKKKVSAPAKN